MASLISITRREIKREKSKLEKITHVKEKPRNKRKIVVLLLLAAASESVAESAQLFLMTSQCGHHRAEDETTKLTLALLE